MQPFETDERKSERFGIEFKQEYKSKTTLQQVVKVTPPQSSESQKTQQNPHVYQAIQFPPIPESFSRPQEVVVASPQNSAAIATDPVDGESANKSDCAIAPPAQPPVPSPTHTNDLDEVELQAEQALADVERLLSDTADSAGEDANVLRALTSKDAKVETSEFAALIHNVVKDAIDKTRQSTLEQQQQQSGSSDASTALSVEVDRIQQAGANMLASMQEIVAQVRTVVLDPTFIDETIHKARLNREFQFDLVQSKKPSPRPQLVHLRGATPEGQPGEATPLGVTPQPHASVVELYDVDDVDSWSHTNVDLAAKALAASPTRVQKLKEQLIRNGLRELLIDMTQEKQQEFEIQLTTTPPMTNVHAKQARQVIQNAKITSETVPTATHAVNKQPRHKSLDALPNDLSHSPAPLHSPMTLASMEVNDVMAGLVEEQQAIGAQLRQQRDEKRKSASQELHPPMKAALHVTCSPSGSEQFLSPRSLAGPDSSKSRSPRIHELMKLELVKAVRQIEKDEANRRAAKKKKKAKKRSARKAANKSAQYDSSDTDGVSSSDFSDFDSSDSSSSSSPSSSDCDSDVNLHRSNRVRRNHRSGSNGMTRPATAGAFPSSSPMKDGSPAGSSVISNSSSASVSLLSAEDLARQQLEMEKLSLEREKLSWEASKLREQQKAYEELLERNKSAAMAQQAQHDLNTATTNAQQLESVRLEFEKMKFQLEQSLQEERMKLTTSRVELENHLREVELVRKQQERAARRLILQETTPKTTEAAKIPSAIATAVTPTPLPPPAAVTPQRPAQSTSPIGPNIEGYGSAPTGQQQPPVDSMRLSLEAYVAKRKAKKERRARREREKEEQRRIAAGKKSSSRPTSRRNSLSGALVVGSVSTTPLETALTRFGHHENGQLASSVGVAPSIHHRGSSRNLLTPWTVKELNEERPLRIAPTQEDLEKIERHEGADAANKVWQQLAKYQRYDRIYQQFLDPSGELTKAAIDKLQSNSLLTSQQSSYAMVTPPLYLYLHLSLIDLHKISFMQRCRPVVEIYSVRGTGRTQLLYESEIASDACSAFDPSPILLKLDEVCYGQLERDILIRVTHVPQESDGLNRVLLGEYWTNLFTLQSSRAGTKVPLLRARESKDASEKKGPKEKGTLVIHSQDLFIRTSHGLVKYPSSHPNRLLPTTFPPIYEKNTSCFVSFVPSCSNLHLIGPNGSVHKKALNKSGKLVPFLEFFRQEEDGLWGKNHVVRTEELILTIGSESSTDRSEGIVTPSTNQITTWKPLQLPLYDLCFGDLTRPILCKVFCSGSISGRHLLTTFQFALGEIVGQYEPTVVMLDAHFGQPTSIGLNPNVNDATLRGMTLTSPTGAMMTGNMTSSLVTLGRNDDKNQPCIAFTRAHVYSSLTDLQQLVQCAGIVTPIETPPSSSSSSSSKKELKVLSCLHMILCDQEKRKVGQDQSVILNFPILGAPNSAAPTTTTQIKKQPLVDPTHATAPTTASSSSSPPVSSSSSATRPLRSSSVHNDVGAPAAAPSVNSSSSPPPSIRSVQPPAPLRTKSTPTHTIIITSPTEQMQVGSANSSGIESRSSQAASASPTIPQQSAIQASPIHAREIVNLTAMEAI